MNAEDDRERVLGLLKRHGWNATSFQVLEPGFRYAFFGDDAAVAYVEAAGAWVAAGAPIAPQARVGEVARAFAERAAAAGRAACFFAAEGRLLEAAGMAGLCIGEQPVWDPRAWESTLKGSRSLKEQLRRARAKGVAVREVPASEIAAPGSAGRAAAEALVARWLASRRMAPMGFLVGLELFGDAAERRYFLAEQGGQAVGLLSAVPVYARGGWLFEDLLRGPGAPNGTAELLVDAAMRAAAAAGSGYVTLGMAPLAGEVAPALRAARGLGAVLYDFDGVRAFKAKLRPARWDPVYLAHPAGVGPLRAVHAALAAFAGGGLLRFGLQTVLRGPPVIVRLLAALLVPWTALLALADTPRWFPSRAVQAGWVLFDALLCAALFGLAARWRGWLALALAAAITADAAVTAAEAALYNLPRLAGAGSAAVVAAGVLAPAGAACVLWGALRARLKD